MNKKKSDIILFLLIILIIGVISAIEYAKNTADNKEVMECIAKNSFVFVSKTCTACAYQKEILGRYAGVFDIRDISEHPEAFTKYKITGTPTWIINEKTFAGTRSIEQLKEVTSC